MGMGAYHSILLLIAVVIAGTAMTCGEAVCAKMTTVDVTRFGAVAGDGKSDTSAVLAAIEECKKHRPSVLVLPKGQYDFFDTDRKAGANHVFALDGLQDVTVDGRGSTLMFHGYPGAFALSNCKNLTVRNFTIDYERPPFSLGTVVASGDHCIDVEVDKEYPITGKEGVGAFMLYDRVGHHPLAKGVEHYATMPTELVRPGVMRLRVEPDFKFPAGTAILLRHAVYGPGAFMANNCSGLTLEHIDIHTAPGMAFAAGKCTDLTVRNVRVVPRPGSNWPMSVTADGLHFSGCRGTITVENCEFDGQGDDAANIKTGLYSKVLEKIDDHTVLAQHHLKMADPPSPGDKVEFAHHADMVTYATLPAGSFELLKDNVLKLRFKDPLPADLQIGDLLGNATRVAKVRIRNCQMRNNRARGFLLQNRDVLVENCKFANCTSGGIWVLTECFYFYECITSRNVTVRNCIFDNCGYWPGPGVLGAFVMLGPDSFAPKPGAHKNITFEGNVIRGADNSGIFLNGVDGAVLRNNTIENVCRDPQHKAGDDAVSITACKNVSVEGNRCDPAKQGAGCKAVFKTGSGTDETTVKLSRNTGF